MKRSEMSNKLEKFAEQHQLFDLRDQYGYIIANQIIDFLLNEGMYPPVSIEKQQSMPLNHLDAMLDCLDEDLTWDKE